MLKSSKITATLGVIFLGVVACSETGSTSLKGRSELAGKVEDTGELGLFNNELAENQVYLVVLRPSANDSFTMPVVVGKNGEGQQDVSNFGRIFMGVEGFSVSTGGRTYDANIQTTFRVRQQALEGDASLFRCKTEDSGKVSYTISNQENCEGNGVNEGVLGYLPAAVPKGNFVLWRLRHQTTGYKMYVVRTESRDGSVPIVSGYVTEGRIALAGI